MDAYRGVTELTAMTSIGIARGNVARIQNARGVLLSAQHGAVWITQKGSPDDVCIGAGQSFRIARDGLTLVVPVGGLALVTLVPATRMRPSLATRIATRFWSFWAGLYRLPSRPSTSWI
jgi:hypothetical protein